MRTGFRYLKTCVIAGFVFVSVMIRVASAQSLIDCGSIENAYGPYDYTNPQHRIEYLPRVEEYHFDVGVESLKGLIGLENSQARLGGDIDYTLRAFPNHHRALYTMIRYYLEKVPTGADKLRYTPECWFDRAKRFADTDATVIMLEGLYFHKINDLSRANASYEQALRMAPRSAEINYNAGLFFLEINDVERAVELAELAYQLGYPLPGLRNRLMRMGAWKND